MNREDFAKRFEESKGRALSVELEKFENKHSVGLETLVNKFLAEAYSSYDTKEKFVLNTLLTTEIPPSEWKEIDEDEYRDSIFHVIIDDKNEQKREVIDEKKEISKYYERTAKKTIYNGYSNLHDILKMFVKELLSKKGYFIIEKLEPRYTSTYYDRAAYEYLEVYYDEQIYKYEYQGINTDVKAMIKEVERLLIAIKEENKI